MKLQIHKEVGFRVPRQSLNRLFDLIVARELKRGAHGAVNLILTSDTVLRKLNNDFRNVDKSTDVLSFNIDDPVDDESVLGEIYISVPTARTQASEYGASLSDEICRLFSHGLLHLAGYDHKNEEEAKRMFSVADKYMNNVKRGSDDD